MAKIQSIIPAQNVEQYTKVIQFVRTHHLTFSDFLPMLDSMKNMLKTAEYINKLSLDKNDQDTNDLSSQPNLLLVYKKQLAIDKQANLSLKSDD